MLIGLFSESTLSQGRRRPPTTSPISSKKIETEKKLRNQTSPAPSRACKFHYVLFLLSLLMLWSVVVQGCIRDHRDVARRVGCSFPAPLFEEKSLHVVCADHFLWMIIPKWMLEVVNSSPLSELLASSLGGHGISLIYWLQTKRNVFLQHKHTKVWLISFGKL